MHTNLYFYRERKTTLILQNFDVFGKIQKNLKPKGWGKPKFGMTKETGIRHNSLFLHFEQKTASIVQGISRFKNNNLTHGL